jgi:tetratricopeptide (TPR) repeat protein
MNLHTRFAMGLLFTGVAFAQSDSMQRGLQLFQQQSYEAALVQFEQARRAHPGDASLVNFIGITETRLGRLEEANKDYEIAARLDPRLPGPHKNLGFNYLGKGQYDLAEKQLRTALALNAADPFVHYYLAIVYLSTARDAEALPHLQPAESLLGNDAATAFSAIAACLKLNADDEALQLIAILEAHASLSAQQEFQLAEMLNERQMYSASAARFRRIAEMQPGSWQNQYNLAIALVRARQVDQALPLLATLTAEHGADANLLSSVGSAYEAAGESSLALEAYRKAIAADPSNPDRYLDCTRLLMDLDRYDEAIALIRTGMTAVADEYPLTIRQGAIEMMRGNREAARVQYRNALAEHPAVALGYVALAQSYMKEGNDQEALRILTDGRATVGRDFALEYVYGLVSFQLGQQPQAMDAFKNAETLAPTVVEPHYQLGLLYMKLQQWPEAQKEFELVLKLDAHHAGAYYQLSRTYQRLGDTGKAQQMAKEASLLTKTQREEATKAQELRFGVPGQH